MPNEQHYDDACIAVLTNISQNKSRKTMWKTSMIILYIIIPPIWDFTCVYQCMNGRTDVVRRENLTKWKIFRRVQLLLKFFTITVYTYYYKYIQYYIYRWIRVSPALLSKRTGRVHISSAIIIGRMVDAATPFFIIQRSGSFFSFFFHNFFPSSLSGPNS